MPSDKPDDMRDDHPFTPRQVQELDQRFARVDERFDKLEADMDQRFAEEREERRAEMHTLRAELRADFAHDIGVAMGAVFDQWREAMRGDLLQALGVSLDDFERSQRLATEPVAARVETIENENLPVRVTKLEASLRSVR